MEWVSLKLTSNYIYNKFTIYIFFNYKYLANTLCILIIYIIFVLLL